MCGILVIISKKKIQLNKKRCLLSLDELINRGPDKNLHNFFDKDTIFMGNSVLNITGTFKDRDGSELFSSKNKNTYLAFNGEIYNYLKLKKKASYLANYDAPYNTDTEILAEICDRPKLPKLFKQLNGMYSISTYNIKNNRIIFATDPQGEKRLLKYEDNDYLIISSTSKAIIKFLKKDSFLNNDIFCRYFKTRHFIYFKKTLNDKINYLDPGKLYEYNINKNELHSEKFDDPISWINKNDFDKYNKIGFKKASGLLDVKLKSTLELMSTQSKFATSFSGGVDSMLVSHYLKQKKNLNFFLSINNIKKDPVADNVHNFSNFFALNKLKEIKINVKKYFSSMREVYANFNSPLLSHDLVGRNILFKFLKTNKIRVFFGGDGADELFGGYTLYEKINWDKDVNYNQSPYSSIKEPNNLSEASLPHEIWIKAFKKYNTFLSKKESRMQASLYTDYFIQCVGVHNITNDILGGENSLEVRSVFLNKDIIKFALNLPIKYKINLKEKDPLLRTKPILKQLFIKNFGKINLLPKVGFSGFPNETKTLLNKRDKIKFLNLCNNFRKKYTNGYFVANFDRAIEWKILNIFYYNKFLKKDISIKKIF